MSTILLALRVLVSLGVVVGLLWFVQRRTTRWSAKRKTSSTVSLIARKSLGSKTNLVVIEVEGTRFVLGVSEHSVSVLQSAPAAEASADAVPVAALSAEAAPVATLSSGPHPAPSFEEVLAQESDPEGADDAARQPQRRLQPQGSASLPRRDFSGFSGSIVSLETWKQAARSLRGPRWP